MNKFPAVTGLQIIKALRKLGFDVIRSKESHHFLHHSDGQLFRFIVKKSSAVAFWRKSFATAK